MSDDDNVEDLYQDFHDNPMYWAEKYTELRTLAQEAKNWIDADSLIEAREVLVKALRGD